MQGTGGLFVLVAMQVGKIGIQGTRQRLLRTSPFLRDKLEIKGRAKMKQIARLSSRRVVTPCLPTSRSWQV